MNLLHSGSLLVFFVILEAISGLTPDKSIISNQTQDLSPEVHVFTEKSQQDNGVKESLKIIAPSARQIVVNTTVAPPTTTTTSTTTTTTSTTTTSTTSTTSTTTTTPEPPPAPTNNNGTWVIRNNTTNTVCIIANMTMQLNISYPAKNKKQLYQIVTIPKDSSISGNCSESPQTLVISWGPGHNLIINFNANETTKNFFVSGINLDVNATVFKNATVDPNTLWHFANNTKEFTTPEGMSYKCNRLQKLSLTGENENLKAVLSIKDAQLQAFMNKTTPVFEAAQDCDTFDTPDVVPIAVGCALAILVLVVLVAYLIGRKRSQNRGYLSMYNTE